MAVGRGRGRGVNAGMQLDNHVEFVENVDDVAPLMHCNARIRIIKFYPKIFPRSA